MGVVLEQLVSQSSKAESLPSVLHTPLVSETSVDVAAAAATAAAAAEASAAACWSCTILFEGSWRREGGVGVSANFQMCSHKSDAVH